MWNFLSSIWEWTRRSPFLGFFNVLTEIIASLFKLCFVLLETPSEVVHCREDFQVAAVPRTKEVLRGCVK